MANQLIHETSPYLLQHAQNPVNWHPWGKEALLKAKQENKLLLVSIGYAACHWCHVMEHESFQNQQVANLMNAHFICIKVDREERPDIDQIYMHAVQLMTGHGGWPLNCICLPDQRPIYGGTYFKPDDWKNLLQNLAIFWKEKPDQAIEYAEKLITGIEKSEQIPFIWQTISYSQKDIEEIFETWKRFFDPLFGGYQGAPKFPLPNNWQFMLRYAHLTKNQEALDHTFLTLEKMALGGLYDPIGGGFARYTVDERWHIPHFEKMLYDNAQLISLYSEAYQHTANPLFKKVVYQTLEFVKNELTCPEMGFYASLDADSQGVEGKFYTFTKRELVSLLGADAELFCLYYNITSDGNWQEEHTNVLYQNDHDLNLSRKLKIPLKKLQTSIHNSCKKIFDYRSKRVKPNLDYKIITSWNAMMLKAYTDAYRVFNDIDFFTTAKANAHFLLENMFWNEKLMRIYKKNLAPNQVQEGFLDDYAFLIDGLISLYEVSFDTYWLEKAKTLCDHTLQYFFDKKSGLFFYTSKTDRNLIVNKQEIIDHVIPSSNAVMAHNLFKLGHAYSQEDYLNISRQQLQNIYPHIQKQGTAYSHWTSLLLYNIFGFFEITITGQNLQSKRQELEKYFIPNKILLAGASGSVPLLRNKQNLSTKIFVCKNKTCYLPCAEVKDALKHIFSPSRIPKRNKNASVYHSKNK